MVCISFVPVYIAPVQPVDFYFNYSAAGPAYISKVVLDDKNTGKHFTFQDFMGIGIFAGKKRNINAEIKIQHYSNGNIFTANPGPAGSADIQCRFYMVRTGRFLFSRVVF